MALNRQITVREWAEKESFPDQVWIAANRERLWRYSLQCFQSAGRGTIVVNVAPEWLLDRQPVLRYLTAERAARLPDTTIANLVNTYDPDCEFVVVFLKAAGVTTVYRSRVDGNTGTTAPALPKPALDPLTSSTG